MISAIAEICPHCGVRQLPMDVGRPLDASDKRLVPAALLCVLLGVFGAHRFYVGKTGTGVLQLFTLGGLGAQRLGQLGGEFLGRQRQQRNRLRVRRSAW